MMRYLLIVVCLWFIVVKSAAQISEGGMPYSFHQSQLKAKAIIPEYKLKKVNKNKLEGEDKENPSPFRYSVYEQTEIDLLQGTAHEIKHPAGTIWRYSIFSDDAYSIQVVFKKFYIPPGARLHLYNHDYTEIYGAFTHQNNSPDSTFTIADFPGNELTLEYFEPHEAAFRGRLIIGFLGQAYKQILHSPVETLQEGFVDINCKEGKDWQTEKHAVCKITFRVGNSGYVCSGALINNTSNDGTPYFLTANHCIDDTTVAKTVVAYFNYEKLTCNGRVQNGRTLSGSRLLSTGTRSDYSLLRLNNTPPASYMPYYAGWDIGNYRDSYNTSIHHPEGIEKKISVDYDRIITYDYPIVWDEDGGTTPASSHWLVTFDIGSTSEGSSGGPLFSRQKRIIGQLHGGSDNEEFYGKLNYSWNNNASGFPPLKNFLDPKNTGATFVNGYYPPTNPPDAFFSSEYTNVCLNSPVTLTDNSAFDPASRTWTISPSGFRYVNGTGRNSANPQVEFTVAGSYTVKLVVANKNGSDSLQVSTFIRAGNTIDVNTISNIGNTLCYNRFDSLVMTGTGASEYTWSLSPSDAPFVFRSISGDTAILQKQSGTNISSDFAITIQVAGKMGTCTDTARQTIRFVKVINDNIANAIEIGLGVSDTFSNFCATIEPNEPVPPFDSCTGLKSWCDEYGTGKNIVENSVWFTFKGPATGKAGLKSLGFDNQIAIYQANSYQDILQGRYTLLAANDDESDSNPYPVIPEVNVTPGRTYWIQVDGSGGGSEGEFTLTLSDRNITSDEEIEAPAEGIVLYPQPVSGTLIISGEEISGRDTDIQVVSLSGKVLMELRYHNPGERISLDVGSLSPGTYLLVIKTPDKQVVKKFIRI